ncbi:TetR/AcrR family transcriptional regulator [Kineosporia mesophila]|uniref:TetR/AcrR family transcriptional regulator n=1 Tax=Kineosporia mesophila TaxID=566012 RepID=A0ABP6ZEM6_9ACTN|nr:TetR/AcrR family transcriptional regulator [Kineosporia mesophila]MCD5350349.1 TetR/AcrR family transcriptional regulator [Kineosporia mesophila]
MARWEPNTRLRLIDAAVELFAENGYEATTVAQIAAHVGVSKMTFFRHFPDKREVLFAGQEEQVKMLHDAVAAAPASATPFETVAAAVVELAAYFPPERREPSARLHAVVASHEDLRERSAFKHARLAQALEQALIERAVPAATAGLAADLGARALREAFVRWRSPGYATDLTVLARETLDEFHEAVDLLG